MKIRVTAKQAEIVEQETLTTGSQGIMIAVEFSAEWDGLAKTAQFYDGTHLIPVLMLSDFVLLPWEMTSIHGAKPAVVFIGKDSTGRQVMPTVECDMGTVWYGIRENIYPPDPPTPGWVEQIEAAIKKNTEDIKKNTEDIKNLTGGKFVTFEKTGDKEVSYDVPFKEIHAAMEANTPVYGIYDGHVLRATTWGPIHVYFTCYPGYEGNDGWNYGQSIIVMDDETNIGELTLVKIGKNEVFTAHITDEVGRAVCDMTASEIIDADRIGVVKAEYTDPATDEIRTYYYFKQTKDRRAVFAKDGYIEDGVMKSSLIYVDSSGYVTVETRPLRLPVGLATCDDVAASPTSSPNVWYIPKTVPRPSGIPGMMLDVKWTNGHVGGLGYNVSLIWGEAGGADNEVIVDPSSVSGGPQDVSVPVGGTVRYQLVDSGSRMSWKYVSGNLLKKQYSTATAPDTAEKVVPGLSGGYLPGMDIYLQVDKGNTSDTMTLVPADGQSLPVYGNGRGKTTGTIPAGYILHLKNAGDHWQIVNQPGGVPVDDTLTKSGQAADAKVTGEKISQLNESKADKALYDLAYGDDGKIHITIDGEIMGKGILIGTPKPNWTVTQTLNGCTSNFKGDFVGDGKPLRAKITPISSYTLVGASASIKMAGVDITSTAYKNGIVEISAVTGDVIIAITAVRDGIVFTTPTINEFDHKIIGSDVYLNAYKGQATNIEMPTELESGGKQYRVLIWNLSFPEGVERVRFPAGSKSYIGGTGSYPKTIKSVEGLGNVEGKGAYPKFMDHTALESIPQPLFGTNFSQTFWGCTGLPEDLRDVVLPKTTEYMRDTFAFCAQIKYGPTIPANVSDILQLFYNCGSVNSFRVESKIAAYSDVIIHGSKIECEMEAHSDSKMFAGMKAVTCTASGAGDMYFKSIENDVVSVSCFGDSLTQGQGVTPNYTTALDMLLPEKSIVYCYGQGGTTMEQIRDRVLSHPVHTKESVVILWAGTNGSAATATPETMIACTDEMLAGVKSDKYIIMTPVYRNYTKEKDTAYAAKYGGHYFSLRDWFDASYTIGDYITDGTHFNAEGNRLIAQAVFEKGQQLGYWT